MTIITDQGIMLHIYKSIDDTTTANPCTGIHKGMMHDHSTRTDLSMSGNISGGSNQGTQMPTGSSYFIMNLQP